MNEDNIFQKYDNIVTSTLLNIQAESRNKEIVLGNFNKDNINHLYFFEISKIAQTCWNFTIFLDMSLLKYLKFKFKNRKLNLKKMKKRQANNKVNIDEILNFIQQSFKESGCIFSNIYHTYYKKDVN